MSDPVTLGLALVFVVMGLRLAVAASWLTNALERQRPQPTAPRPIPSARPSRPVEVETVATVGPTSFLPVVWVPPPPPHNPEPIWAGGDGRPGSVALFRRAFNLPAESLAAELSIVADTRYEVWLDGTWLGRGPARLARARQEYDTFALGDLAAGSHVVAALVQYAPNLRRSESTQPALLATLHTWDGTAWQTLAGTDSTWKALVSPAWDADAEQVSALELIGPMEVLDLGHLPADWMEASFDDSAWPQARPVSPSPFTALSARTIPVLIEQAQAPLAVVESGLLSPGYRLVDLEPEPGAGLASTATLVITAPGPAMLRLEAIDDAPVAIDDGEPLSWTPLGSERRPDVMVAEQALPAGPHRVSIAVPGEQACAAGWPAGLPLAPDMTCSRQGGRTLAVRLDGLALGDVPGVALVHNPGRRTLLAEPVPGGPGAPHIQLLDGYAEVVIPPGDSPRYLVLDLGRIVYGRPSLIADGPAGTVIDIGWDERLTAGRPLPNPGSLVSSLWSQVDSWALDGTPRRLTTIDARCGRYLWLSAFGEGPVWLHEVRAIEELYPAVDGQRGWFQSSDPLLDRVWQTGVDTLRLNMTDAYTDTPWRERGQWWADALIGFYANRAALGDLALFRRGLRQMADAVEADGRPAALAPNGGGEMLLDYGMQWIEGLALYWRLSGDLDLVRELYPAAERLAGYLAGYEGAAGLLDVPPGGWWQTALVDWPAASSRSGESTALNAQYAAALDDMGELAAALDLPDRARAYRERSLAVESSLNTVLFMPAEGRYSASRVDGALLPSSLHAQAWALRYGVVPAEHRSSTLRALAAALTPFYDSQGRAAIEPPGMFYTLEALLAEDATGLALALVRERYGAMLDQGATSWWELYALNQHRFHSLSHAWGSSPTWFLSSHVLGAHMTGPAAWQVAPHPAYLDFARGAVPLGPGVLEVEWRQLWCGQFELDVVAPPDTLGEIVLPVWHYEAAVVLDGVLVWSDGPTGVHPVEMTADGLRVAQVNSGEHQVLATFTCRQAFLPVVGR